MAVFKKIVVLNREGALPKKKTYGLEPGKVQQSTFKKKVACFRVGFTSGSGGVASFNPNYNPISSRGEGGPGIFGNSDSHNMWTDFYF